MKPSFNLLHEPWIPCIRLDGQLVELGIIETLERAPEIREVWAGNVIANAALYRLLAVFTQRAVIPEGATTKTWGQIYRKGQWDMARVSGYAQQWSHRFDLFDEKYPFYQVAGLDSETCPAVFILPDMSKNGVTLFQHQTQDRPVAFSPATAARALVTSQTFSLGGGNSGKGFDKYTDSPWAKGAVFIVYGRNLFETLLLNTFPYTQSDPIPSFPDDCPSWESDSPLKPRGTPRGYYDYMTWPARRLLLIPEEQQGETVVIRARFVQGLRLGSNEGEMVFDPMKCYLTSKDGKTFAIGFDPNRVLWRNSFSLFQMPERKSEQATIAPRAFRHLARLVESGALEESYRLRYMALGMMRNQGQVVMQLEQVMPLPVTYTHDEVAVAYLKQAITLAEMVGERIVWAAKDALVAYPVRDDTKEAKQGRDPKIRTVIRDIVERHYWASLELGFAQAMVDIPVNVERAMLGWQKVLDETAKTAFEEAMRGLGATPRALKAAQVGRNRLYPSLRKTLADLYKDADNHDN
jgi:CRISPR system Cascade subunit CasA